MSTSTGQLNLLQLILEAEHQLLSEVESPAHRRGEGGASRRTSDARFPVRAATTAGRTDLERAGAD